MLRCRDKKEKNRVYTAQRMNRIKKKTFIISILGFNLVLDSIFLSKRPIPIWRVLRKNNLILRRLYKAIS